MQRLYLDINKQNEDLETLNQLLKSLNKSMSKNTQRKDKILKISGHTPIEYIPKIITNSCKFMSGFEKIDLQYSQFGALLKCLANTNKIVCGDLILKNLRHLSIRTFDGYFYSNTASTIAVSCRSRSRSDKCTRVCNENTLFWESWYNCVNNKNCQFWQQLETLHLGFCYCKDCLLKQFDQIQMIASKLINVETIYFQNKETNEYYYKDDEEFHWYLALPQWFILHFIQSIGESQLKHNKLNNNGSKNNHSNNNNIKNSSIINNNIPIKLSNINCCPIDKSTDNEMANITLISPTVAQNIKSISIDCSNNEWIPTPLFITNSRCSCVMKITVTLNRRTNIAKTIKSLFSHLQYPNLNKITIRGEIDSYGSETLFSAIHSNILAVRPIVKDIINTDDNNHNDSDNDSNNDSCIKFEDSLAQLNEINLNLKVNGSGICDMNGYKCKYLCALEKNFTSVFKQLLEMIEKDNYNDNVKYHVNIDLETFEPTDRESVAFSSDLYRCDLMLRNMIRQWIGSQFSYVKNNYVCRFTQEQTYDDGEILGLSLSPL